MKEERAGTSACGATGSHPLLEGLRNLLHSIDLDFMSEFFTCLQKLSCIQTTHAMLQGVHIGLNP